MSESVIVIVQCSGIRREFFAFTLIYRALKAVR